MREIKLSDIRRRVVGVDPPGGLVTECGIIVAGVDNDGNSYVLDDKSLSGTPGEWSAAAINAYISWQADSIVLEINFGGLMAEQTIFETAKGMNCTVGCKNVHATRGKAVRAEPIVAAYEHGRVHHVGEFPQLEDEMVTWIPGISHFSPNRIDALVCAITELNLKREVPPRTPTYYIPDLSHTPTRGRHL
jgi:phage terminase large subunit-like protein